MRHYCTDNLGMYPDWISRWNATVEVIEPYILSGEIYTLIIKVVSFTLVGLSSWILSQFEQVASALLLEFLPTCPAADTNGVTKVICSAFDDVKVYT